MDIFTLVLRFVFYRGEHGMFRRQFFAGMPMPCFYRNEPPAGEPGIVRSQNGGAQKKAAGGDAVPACLPRGLTSEVFLFHFLNKRLRGSHNRFIDVGVLT